VAPVEAQAAVNTAPATTRRAHDPFKCRRIGQRSSATVMIIGLIVELP
jgi:hypothetical protein